MNDSNLHFDRIKAKRILKVSQKKAATFKVLRAAGKTSVKSGVLDVLYSRLRRNGISFTFFQWLNSRFDVFMPSTSSFRLANTVESSK